MQYYVLYLWIGSGQFKLGWKKKLWKWQTCFDSSLFLQLLIKSIGVVCHLTLDGKRLCHTDNASTQSGCSCTKSVYRITASAEQQTTINPLLMTKVTTVIIRPLPLSWRLSKKCWAKGDLVTQSCFDKAPPYHSKTKYSQQMKLSLTCPAQAVLYQSSPVWPGGRPLMSLQCLLHISLHGPDWAVGAPGSLHWQQDSWRRSGNHGWATCTLSEESAAWVAGQGTEPWSSAHSCT